MNNVETQYTVDTYPFTVTTIVGDMIYPECGFHELWLDFSDLYDDDRETRRLATEALAKLRRKITAYRLSPDFADVYELTHNIHGYRWTLHERIIRHIADQLATSEPLDVLLPKSAEKGKKLHDDLFNRRDRRKTEVRKVVDLGIRREAKQLVDDLVKQLVPDDALVVAKKKAAIGAMIADVRQKPEFTDEEKQSLCAQLNQWLQDTTPSYYASMKQEEHYDEDELYDDYPSDDEEDDEA